MPFYDLLKMLTPKNREFFVDVVKVFSVSSHCVVLHKFKSAINFSVVTFTIKG
jgi:hypothetical protein